MNLFVIFLTGLTTGGLSCLAMQGGLLASVIANQKGQEYQDPGQNVKDWLPVGMFLVAKLVSHTILGFLLGLLGSAITLSLGVRLAFQTFTALFMFATAMNLLDVHPLFRFVVFQPPRFIQRMVRNSSKSSALFAPAVLGFMTIFIPCGVTQAMEVLAINSGNPVYGAMIMFSFVLGTTPLFAALGVATAKLSEGWYSRFTRFAAYALITMALYSLNGVLVVADSSITFQKLTEPVRYYFSDERMSDVLYGSHGSDAAAVKVVAGVQPVTIGVFNQGYSPNYIQVQAGVPVQLTLQSNDTYSCALAFVMKEFGINTFLESTDTQTFTFTPERPGKYTFTCSMGMYTGIMEAM